MDPRIPKKFTQSKKTLYFAISLAIAITMQYLGKFNGDFPSYLQMVTFAILGSQAAQDVGQAISKK
jgi:hypothetical protein